MSLTYGEFTRRQEVFHAGFTEGPQIVSQSSSSFRTPTDRSSTMDTSSNFRLTLTPEQKEEIRKATGKEVDALEMPIEELEERIAPTTLAGRHRPLR